MSKKHVIAIFCLVGAAITFGFVLKLKASPEPCDELKKSQAVYRGLAQARIEKTRAFFLEQSEKLLATYRNLQQFENKMPMDIEPEARQVEALGSELQILNYEFYDFADADDALFQNWSEAHVKCFGQTKMDVLSEWQMANNELLNSAAGFLSGYASQIGKWPKIWRKQVQQKNKFQEGDFDEVEQKAQELAEAGALLLESFDVVDALFVQAQP